MKQKVQTQIKIPSIFLFNNAPSGRNHKLGSRKAKGSGWEYSSGVLFLGLTKLSLYSDIGLTVEMKTLAQKGIQLSTNPKIDCRAN